MAAQASAPQSAGEQAQASAKSAFNARESQMGAQNSAMKSGRQGQNVTVVRTMPKVGRNDPCPCGSGKKYKNCHGRNA
jgi:preprotein translocase subunit SecA